MEALAQIITIPEIVAFIDENMNVVIPAILSSLLALMLGDVVMQSSRHVLLTLYASLLYFYTADPTFLDFTGVSNKDIVLSLRI